MYRPLRSLQLGWFFTHRYSSEPYLLSYSDLSPLARLGVLWLNTSLTVRAHKAGSHAKKGWEILTGQAIKAVTSRPSSNGVVFMAWGLPAQKTCEKIGIDEVGRFDSFLACAH